ncbi:NUC169 domain-containing protein [Vararia minispora EC-137]|uniref:NUC169 domain-containing protein n=1 Tax=Vararia minispora EC-137 TaxID=1314806 RepID=A0ACB8QUT7_9AGAM|nr:NUC169 domain-containing protein [Vararia minispora EC-137]
MEGGLEMESEDEAGEGGEDEGDDGEVDAWPEIDPASDTEEEGDEEDEGEDEEQDEEDEESSSSDSSSLHIFPKAKTVISSITGQPKKVYPEIEPDYDSDSSTEDAPNRVGNIPLHWYDDLPHVGYDIDGKKVLKPARGDELDKFLRTVEDPEAWTSAFDKNTQMDKPLTAEELDIIRRLERHENPDASYDPYTPTVEWFTGEGKQEIMPLSAGPEPKRRWVPSKWEKKKVMKIVRAIRQGRIVPSKPKSTAPQFYALWGDDAAAAAHAAPLPAPKPRLPTHAESYNPPAEYLPTADEKKAWEDAEPEDRERDFVPTQHPALRLVPAYDRFVQERFARQLDLYLAPRVQRVKLTRDPSALVPKLPAPSTLRPFPQHRALRFVHLDARVRALGVSPDGAWVASADERGDVCLWEVCVGREVRRWAFGSSIGALEWCPRTDVCFFVVSTEDALHFIVPPHLPPAVAVTTHDLLAPAELPPAPLGTAPAPAKWTSHSADADALLTVALPPGGGVPRCIAWHRRGDYLASVSSGEGPGGVWVHQVSRRHSQAPFKKVTGAVQCVRFHPVKPHFFVATQRYVRIYDLAEQKLLKTLLPGIRWISAMDVHPSGEHLIVGGYDRKLCWFDLGLSDKPYKVMRYHTRAIRSLAFHGTYPLFASASDDGALQLFHARVHADLMADPLIVPLKILRGHDVADGLGVLAVGWVPGKPWAVSAGADGGVVVWMH